ncbi:DUF2339 domain-containing protein [Skermania sp. ID1734]|uniref:DUF2339 domain-containing protein n=1 Tax=Skermania sp. ID1734 TaxID=2597516 RepID=UPI00163DC8D7|nr:DUF2339 domain-containing protein [Skermania sp. ID1734]
MTSGPLIDPARLEWMSGELAALARRVDGIGAELNMLGNQLRHTPPVPGYAPPPPGAWPQPAPQPVPPRPWPPTQPVVRRPPWWQREGVVSRLLAVAGAGVTLVGVVLLLVLAAQAGLFGPAVRVGAGAALSAALVCIGQRVRTRPGGNVGGIAMAATGFAGGYLDVVAMTVFYGWLAAPVGLAIALAIAACGMALAVSWRSQWLAVLVLCGVAVLAPALTDGITIPLIAFLAVLQFGCAPVQLLRDWSYVHIARTAPVVIALLLALGEHLINGGTEHRVALLVACIVVAAIGAVSGVAATRRVATDVTASTMLAISALPLLGSPVLVDHQVTVAVQGLLAAAMLGLGAYSKLASHIRIAAAVAGLALLNVCVVVTRAETLPIALFAVSVAFLAVSFQQRARGAYFMGLAFALGGMVAYLDAVAPDALVTADRAAAVLGVSTILASLLGVGALALLVRQALHLGLVARANAEAVCLPAAIAGLYAASAAIIAACVAVGGTDGFTVGHCLATIVWMLVGIAMVLWSQRTAANAHAALGTGLALVAAAVAKLFLFDLATLDGLLRAGAFLAVGLLLLAAGTRYARSLASRGDRKVSSDSAASATR